MTLLFGPGLSSSDIGRLKQAGDIPSLIRHLNNPDPSVQWHAAEALGTCGEKAVPLLLPALQSRVVPVRLGAIEALGAIRDLRAVSPLLGVVHHDASLEVRWAAVLALGEVGSPDAVPFLLYLLRDPNRYLRYGAATTLGRLGWQPANDADTAYMLIARQDWENVRHLGAAALPPLLRDDTPETRASIISVIGQVGDRNAQAACQKALRDRNPRVRWKAVLASMNCGLASHDLPLMVAGRERTGPDPAAAALLNFLFLGIGYNYLGKWWGFPVFMAYMFVIFNAQLALFLLHLPPVLALVIAYPVTAVLGIHTYFLAERMSDTGM
jgi:hypothetical protein